MRYANRKNARQVFCFYLKPMFLPKGPSSREKKKPAGIGRMGMTGEQDRNSSLTFRVRANDNPDKNENFNHFHVGRYRPLRSSVDNGSSAGTNRSRDGR
jgi:hypothetical protein